MPALSAYSNVENTSMCILVEKGYRVWFERDTEMYCCEKSGWDFMAESITELLGVVSIYEYHGSPLQYKEYWWKINEPNLVNSISETRPKFKAIYEK